MGFLQPRMSDISKKLWKILWNLLTFPLIILNPNFFSSTLPFLFNSISHASLASLGAPFHPNIWETLSWFFCMQLILGGSLVSPSEQVIQLEFRSLNITSRLILLKYILQAIPLYLFLVLSSPECIIKYILTLQWNFLWRGTNSIRKWVLVFWDTLCTSKFKGGLGLRDIDILNGIRGARLGEDGYKIKGNYGYPFGKKQFFQYILTQPDKDESNSKWLHHLECILTE
jgi:hypothetical protein